MSDAVVTRFAPSPTGFLHIGGARTALFNWLFSRHWGGKFLLRIEDTDRARSTPQAVDAIFQGLQWLQLDWDEAPVFQFARAARHQEVAHQLLAHGLAYRCYCTPEELVAMKEQAVQEGRPPLYDGRWRDRILDQPESQPYVVRLKTPQEGQTVLHDLVQGPVCVGHQQLDDMVLLRSDGTPTYMLSVVVDDYDMGISHVIRGDDHLTNAFRQIQIYQALGWPVPQFAHIPLIHGPDGAKLSKRHGALGVQAYQEMGFLPEALRNYLLRLGWSHGNDEIISTAEAVEWFDLQQVGKSASRFDFVKLTHLNGHYLRQMPPEQILTQWQSQEGPFSAQQKQRLMAGLPGLQQRAKTLNDLRLAAKIYIDEVVTFDRAAVEKFLTSDGVTLIHHYLDDLKKQTLWTAEKLEESARTFAASQGIELKKLAQSLRVALTGAVVSPPLFEVIEVLGLSLTVERLEKAFNEWHG